MPLLQNKAIAFLKLIRVENLCMIVLTQTLIRYCIIRRLMPPAADDALFLLLVLSTVLIAAAGYIINDYFDVRTDLINHPDTVVVDRIIKRRWAIFLHITLTVAGVLLGMYAAFVTGYLRLALFHIIAAVLLWFYSTDLKKLPITGNLAVALLTAAVPFMPFVFEMALLYRADPAFLAVYRQPVLSTFKIVSVFGLFAFISTVAREIIKDIEDYRGDRATGAHTLPIVWGIRAAKLSAFFTLLITALLLLFAVYNSIRSTREVITLSNVYILVALVLPLVSLAVYCIRAHTTSQFSAASRVLKAVMLLGLAYSFIYII